MTIMGGYGFEAGDPNLRDKIAKLKQKRGAQSGKQRVESFLENELHVDPRELPFSLDAANARMKEIMEANSGFFADFKGNSLGLKVVIFRSDYDNTGPTNGCPACGTTSAGGYWDSVRRDKGEGDWFCYGCDAANVAPLPGNVLNTVTGNDHSGEDWHDLNRCWAAYCTHLKVPDPVKVGEEQITCYSFTTTRTWSSVNTEPVVPPTPEPDITKHASGSVLRIQKATFVDGDLNVERQYIRIGGLFDDMTPTNLDTMMPITDLTGWSVIEEL